MAQVVEILPLGRQGPTCLIPSISWLLMTWWCRNPWLLQAVNTLRPRQDGRHFPDDIFKGIFSNENVWIPLKFSLKFVPKGPINNIPVLVQIMAWRWPGDKPLSGPMVVSLLTHICVTRPQWVNLNLGWLRSVLLYPPYPKDRGMLWFYVEAARRPPPATRRPPPAMVLTR